MLPHQAWRMRDGANGAFASCTCHMSPSDISLTYLSRKICPPGHQKPHTKTSSSFSHAPRATPVLSQPLVGHEAILYMGFLSLRLGLAGTVVSAVPTTARIGQMKIHKLRLHATQGHHPDKHPRLISDGCQQLAVKAAESFAEGLTLDWVCVDLQGVALQGHHEDAPAL